MSTNDGSDEHTATTDEKVDALVSDKHVADDRFASLEDSSRILSGDVQALTATLQVVAELQARQREQAARQDAVDLEIAHAREAALERETQNRSRIRLGAGILTVVLACAAVAIYAILLSHVNNLLDEQVAVQVQTCEIRNQSTQATITREETLARYETIPKLIQVHQDSADALKHAILNCDEFRR